MFFIIIIFIILLLLLLLLLQFTTLIDCVEVEDPTVYNVIIDSAKVYGNCDTV